METPNPTDLTQWLLILAFLTSIVGNVIMCVKLFLPQKREVTMANEYVRKAECVGQHVALKEQVVRIENQTGCLANQVHQDTGNIYEALRSTEKSTNSRIDALAEEVRLMPETIVNLIKNAKQL